MYTDRTANGGQCTISDGRKFTATLGVDLGGVASISSINIYYRTDDIEGLLFYMSVNMLVNIWIK